MVVMDKILALKIKDADNVAIIFSQEATADAVTMIQDQQGKTTEVQIYETIPYGHKIAVRSIKKGEPIVKYGEVIGGATRDIAKGEHVHIHNMDSLRGRGDLNQ